MILELTAAAADRIEADCLVAFLHADDRPPPGVAGLLDWRLNGTLSRLLKEGWFQAADGEALLLVTGRRTRAPRLLVIGLGLRREAGAGRLRRAGAVALARLGGLGVSRAVVGLPGPAEPPLREAEQVVSLVEGFLEAARQPAAGPAARPPSEARPHLLLVVPVTAQPDAAAALAGLRTGLSTGPHFDLRPLSASRGAILPRPTHARPLPSS